MPRGDGTGPSGMGQMTGRGMGLCAGYSVPGYMNSCFRREYAGGFGRRNLRLAVKTLATGQYKEPSKKELLEELKGEKAEIDKAIKELEQKKA
ncbi:MAG: DUF5320 domain-containing protein [Candidatus Diapherotrites archaeon]